MDQLLEFIGNHALLAGGWVAVAAALLYLQIKHVSSGVKSLVPQEVTHLINREDAVVVDIRPIGDFNKGHIAGSKNILYSKIIESQSMLEKHKSKPIILVCANGMQSGTVCQKLKKEGFESVHKLAGGYASWIGEKLPVAKS